MPETAINTHGGEPYHPWLHRICVALAVCTFILIIAGGTVTTKDYGMAVPDWPTSFSYWFVLPLELWSQSPIFWEHTHRVIGAVVGLLAIALAMGAFVFDDRRWIKVTSILLLLLIIIQGLMGGFRVTTETDQMSPWIPLTFRVFHGVTGQLVLALTVVLVAALGRRWLSTPATRDEGGQLRESVVRLDKVAIAVLMGALVVQLTLGAMVRHQGAAEHVRLSIPDFPLSYGQVIPPMSQEKLDETIAQLPQETRDIMLKPKPVDTSAEAAGNAEKLTLADTGRMPVSLVHLHFTHRLGALLVFLISIWVLGRVAGMVRLDADPQLRTLGMFYAILLVLQIMLGVSIIWSGRHDEVTTGHQTVGAALLAVATLLSTRVYRQAWVNAHPDTRWIDAADAATNRMPAAAVTN